MPRPVLPWLLPCLLLSACDTGNDAIASQEGELKSAPFVETAAPIAAADLPAKLTQAFLRSTHTLATTEWNAKWQASLQDPILFFRAFPGGFHKDLAALPPKRRLGREGLCVGDAHPGNFGFQRLGGKTRFVYNDLDDAGFCPVAQDAARYFAALRIFFDDGDLHGDVLEVYVDAVKDTQAIQDIDGDLKPDWDEVRQKELAEVASGTKLLLGGEVKAVTALQRAAVTKALAGLGWLAGWKVLDVAELDRTSGGSGGLDRYWALMEKAGTRTVVECKQTAKPGVEHGLHGKVLTGSNRLQTLKAGLWGYTGADGLSTLTLFSKPFVVRDRMQRKAVDVLKLDGKDRKRVLKAQASVLALLHRPAWQGVKKDDLRAWLKDSSKVLASRWLQAYGVLGGK